MAVVWLRQAWGMGHGVPVLSGSDVSHIRRLEPQVQGSPAGPGPPEACLLRCRCCRPLSSHTAVPLCVSVS